MSRFCIKKEKLTYCVNIVLITGVIGNVNGFVFKLVNQIFYCESTNVNVNHKNEAMRKVKKKKSCKKYPIIL